MPTKPILDLLTYCRTGDGPCAEALAEFRRLLAEEPARLSEDDLLALEALPNELLTGDVDEWESLAAVLDVNAAAREELIRRDKALQELAEGPVPDVRRVVGRVLEPAPEVTAEGPPAGGRTRLWWLGAQPLGACSLNELAGLASLPGGDPDSGPVIGRAREELVRRGYRPPPREDDAGEQFRYLGTTAALVSDRRVLLGGQAVPAGELADFRIQRLWLPPWRTGIDLIIIAGLLPFLLPVLTLVFSAERWRRKVSDDVTGVVTLAGVAGGLWLTWQLGAPVWLVVGYPLLFFLAAGLRAEIEGGDPQPLVLRRHRLTIRTRAGEVHRLLLANADGAALRDSLTRLLEEANLPPTPTEPTGDDP
jgi:hypothetical protein